GTRQLDQPGRVRRAAAIYLWKHRAQFGDRAGPERVRSVGHPERTHPRRDATATATGNLQPLQSHELLQSRHVAGHDAVWPDLPGLRRSRSAVRRPVHILMCRMTTRWLGIGLALLGIVATTFVARGADSSGQWRAYAGTNASAKYAPLDQI